MVVGLGVYSYLSDLMALRCSKATSLKWGNRNRTRINHFGIMEGPKGRTVSINFTRSDDAVTAPVTGVWGGPAQDHQVLIANFYLEHQSLPNIINVEIDEHGRGDPNQGERISRGDLTREVQASLVMSPATAETIGQWLIRKAQAMKRGGSGGHPPEAPRQ